MTLTVDLWWLVTFAVTLIGGGFGLLKLLLGSYMHRIHERLDNIQNAQKFNANELRKLENQLAEHRLEVAKDYVRHTDFVRSLGTLEAKFDNLSLRIDQTLKEAAKGHAHD